MFRDSARHTDRDVARPDAPVAQVVRVAIDRFHEALDVLEIDIVCEPFAYLMRCESSSDVFLASELTIFILTE